MAGYGKKGGYGDSSKGCGFGSKGGGKDWGGSGKGWDTGWHEDWGKGCAKGCGKWDKGGWDYGKGGAWGGAPYGGCGGWDYGKGGAWGGAPYGGCGGCDYGKGGAWGGDPYGGCGGWDYGKGKGGAWGGKGGCDYGKGGGSRGYTGLEAEVTARYLLQDLPENTTETEIRDYFGTFGEIEEVTLKNLYSGKVAGSVKFSNPTVDLRNIMFKQTHELLGQTITVQTHKMQKLQKPGFAAKVAEERAAYFAKGGGKASGKNKFQPY